MGDANTAAAPDSGVLAKRTAALGLGSRGVGGNSIGNSDGGGTVLAWVEPPLIRGRLEGGLGCTGSSAVEDSNGD